MFLMFKTNILEHYRPAFKRCLSMCNIVTVTFCFICMVIILAILAVDMTKRIHIVYIDETRPTFSTNDKFLSIALDSSVIANGFKKFDMTNQKLLKLMKALSPAYLRIGGTMADRLIFVGHNSIQFKHNVKNELDGGECSYKTMCDYLEKPNFTMNGHEWLQLNKLTRNTNLEMIFDLNCLRRFNNGSWDSSNAQDLIHFSNQHNLKLNWELGNEPNAFRHQFNYEVDPEELGENFHTLRSILNKYPNYAGSLLIGPDVTRPQADHQKSEIYLRKFLQDASQVVDAVTWHQYYFNGATARISDFLDPKTFDILKWQITAVKNIVKNDKPIWLGETSSAYGGGAPHLSDRFIATFIWLDKLGIAAKFGLDVVIRQSIFEGHYALIDNNYNPTPDWWVSVLYKKLVGNKVVDCYTPESPKLRLYCQCTKQHSYFQDVPSVTVFGVNLNNRKARIRFEGLIPMDIEEMKNFTVQAYILSTEERIDSRCIFLNGVLLKLTKTDDVPILRPRIVVANPYVEMPAYSLAFWVVPTTLPC